MGKLAKLRLGTPPHKIISVKGMDIAVVVVSSDVIRICEEAISSHKYTKDGITDDLRNYIYDVNMCFHCMRDPEDLNIKVADSIKETRESLDMNDVHLVTQAYQDLMLEGAPKLEMITEEEYTSIKKTLEQTKVNDLNIVSQLHLKSFHLTTISG